MEYEQDAFGRLFTKLNGQYHSYDNKPSLISKNDEQYWHKEGKLHRDDDKPAIIYSNGILCWCKNGKYHRDNDLPAVIHPNGYAKWYIDGKLIKICHNYKPRIKSARNSNFTS